MIKNFDLNQLNIEITEISKKSFSKFIYETQKRTLTEVKIKWFGCFIKTNSFILTKKKR